MTETAAIAKLRKQIDEVLERHVRTEVHAVERPGDVPYCRHCIQDWPCDTTTQARQMTTLLDGLEQIRSEASRFPGARAAEIASQAIASAAQEQEDEGE